MRNKIILFVILIVGIKCKNQNNIFHNDKLISKNFDYPEVLDLKRIVFFFDSQLKDKFESDSLLESYFLFHKKSLKDLDKGSVFLIMSVKEREELLKKISQRLFNDIWALGNSFDGLTGEKKEILYLKTKGKYVNFLKDLGKENSIIRNYVNDLIRNKEISPNQSYIFIDDFESFDFKDDKVRLVMAIHYLTLNSYYNN
jgi:hypothetical protein